MLMSLNWDVTFYQINLSNNQYTKHNLQANTHIFFAVRSLSSYRSRDLQKGKPMWQLNNTSHKEKFWILRYRIRDDEVNSCSWSTFWWWQLPSRKASLTATERLSSSCGIVVPHLPATGKGPRRTSAGCRRQWRLRRRGSVPRRTARKNTSELALW